MLGVRPGVNGICITDDGAGLAAATIGSSSCKVVNGFRFFAAKKQPEMFVNKSLLRLSRVRWDDTGVRRCFDGVPFDFDGVVI